MHQEQNNALRALLKKRLQAVGTEVLRKGDSDPADLDSLDRLARLVDLHDSIRPAPPRPRWPVVLVLLLTLTLLSVLLFVRIPKTTVALDARLSQVSFVLERPALLNEPLVLTSLGVSGLEGVVLPRSRQSPARRLSATDRPLALAILSGNDGERAGSLTLGGLILPAETRVSLSLAESDEGFRLDLKGDEVRAYVTVKGAVRVSGLGNDDKDLEMRSPRSVELQAGSNPLELMVTPAPGADVQFTTQLPVSALSMSRIEDIPNPNQTVVRRLSTLLTGDLYLEGLNGQKYALRPGEELWFEDSLGSIQTISLEQDGISLQYRGVVEGMASGAVDSSRSLMPTLLEWIRAQHGASLLWGTTFYLFGLVMSVLRWWGKLS